MKKVKLLILDVDGVLTDGKKTYNKNHEVLSKSFLCKDFTAIKRFMAQLALEKLTMKKFEDRCI